MENTQFIFDNFILFFGFALAWCVACFGFIAWRRWKRGNWYPPLLESQIKFSENYVSGTSHKNIFTKLGGARNALSVKATANVVLVETIAPFKWIMPYGFNDLEHYILRANIKKIAPFSRFGRDGVILEFVAGAGGVKRIELYLRQRQQFLEALA